MTTITATQKVEHKTIINGTVYNPYNNNGVKKIVDDLVPSASGRNHIPYGNSEVHPDAILIPEESIFLPAGKADLFAGDSDLVLREINKSGYVNGVYVIPKSVIENWRRQYKKRHPDGNNAVSDTFTNGDGTQTHVTYKPNSINGRFNGNGVRIEWGQLSSFKEFRRSENGLEKIRRAADVSVPLF